MITTATEWMHSTWFAIGLCLFLLAACGVKFIRDYKAISVFDGDDIRHFKIPTQDFMAPRIITRAQTLGWDLIERERAPVDGFEYLVFKASDDAQPLSSLLMKLHRSGFSVRPQRVKLSCEENCEDNAQKN